MTLKDIAMQLTTAVQTVPNLVQILRDGLQQVETGEVTYSTTETEIGKWIDGKAIYQKTIIFDSITLGSWTSKAHGISNLDTVLSIEGTIANTSGWNAPLYYWSAADSYCAAAVSATDAQIKAAFVSGTFSARMTIRYTKSN